MLRRLIENLLPKSFVPRVILIALNSFTLFSKVWGLGRLVIKYYSFKITKLTLVVPFLLYFSGYQPTLAIPPFKQSIVHAEFSQEQTIHGSGFSQSFSLPHPGYISTHFSTWHPGIDIAVGLGAPIHPVTEGTVIEAAYGFFGLGHYIIIEHQQGIRSTYGHLGKIYVKVGDQVTKHSLIGEVGLTGHTSGPHTHLEITQTGKYLDPETLLPKLPDLPFIAVIPNNNR